MRHFAESKNGSIEGIAELASWLRVSCCFQRTHPCWCAWARISAELSLAATWTISGGTPFCWGSAQPSPQAATVRPVLWSAGARLCRFLMGDVSGWRAKAFCCGAVHTKSNMGWWRGGWQGLLAAPSPPTPYPWRSLGGIDGTGCLSKTKVPSLRRC